MKRRIVSLFLLISLLSGIFLFNSCNRRYDKEEVEEAARELLHTAEILNTVYYGKGIEFLESAEAIRDGIYRQANPMHLEQLGFSTLDELKDLTEKTFTVKYSATLFDTKLSSLKTEDSLVEIARYYQKYEYDKNNKIIGTVCIMVNSEIEPIFDDLMTFDYSSVKALYSKGENVYLSVNAEVKSEKGDSQMLELKIVLFEEKDGWRIAGPVFANYFEGADRYDELNK